MIRQNIVIVDYGLGNQTSVQRIVQNLGHHCFVTENKDHISKADLVILPGVGSFPAAMELIHNKQLTNVLVERANSDLSILGICLGMQLLANRSEELGVTQGLGLIPGQVKALKSLRSHTGWNTLEVDREHEIFFPFDRQAFFFNHSYVYEGSETFVSAWVSFGERIPAAIRYGKIVGVQFHPEKSQQTGRLLFENLINNLCQVK